ncbi:MAG TPA: AAA family ATPase [Candidatus Acidoferrales bacterium]|jgi:type II secretory pathway predicted ATPase ExeA|nr:AAA family ATPase [Candidatus Acidoferrales bacterium]
MTGLFSSFFDLRDNPFRANPDPRYLFLTQQTKENLDQIIEGIRTRKGLLLLTGEVGTGKTVLLNRLMEWLEQQRIPKAFIFNSHLKADELLDLVLADFGVPFNANRGTPLAHLHSWLQDRCCAGPSPVLFVDEAQGLTLRTLEELRMLLNLQTAQGSLLQIVLCGQPEFEQTLKRPELRQLRQRIALRCRTAPLTLEETQNYIEARLRIAGGSGAAVFHPEAVEALLLYSRGLPRVLNALCEQSLMRAAREKIRPVPGRIVGAAARELQYDEIRPFTPHFAADDTVFSALLQDAPGFAPAPEFFSAAPLAQDPPLDSKASDIPRREPLRLAAAAAAGASASTSGVHSVPRAPAREPGPGAPRISPAPIAFPSPSQRQSASTPAANEIIESLASAPKTAAPIENRVVARTTVPRVVAPLPIARKQAAKQENEFRKRWRNRYISVTNSIQSALSATALVSRVRLAQVQTRAVAAFRSVSGPLSAWRNKNWNVSTINSKWRALASSCLHWLRAPSHATKRQHALPKSHAPAPQTGSSARLRAILPVGSHRLPRAARSQFIRGPEKAPRVAAFILQWLQEPSPFMRARKSPRTSSTHLT